MFITLIGVLLLVVAIVAAVLPFVLEDTKRNFKVIGASAIIGFFLVTFQSAFFYAEPGYIYHVRTIFGTEKVVSDVGYNAKWFGRVTDWKRAMTVQAVNSNKNADGVVNAESDSVTASANLSPLNIMFLDQVDANAEATVRFSIPSDREAFLNLAHEYRTPDNLLRVALIPAFKETLHATGSLMSAEEYYAGGRTEFNVAFENQMTNGIYIVKRLERDVVSRAAKSSANASLDDQTDYGDEIKTEFIVEKQVDDNGFAKRKEQKFIKFGITVVDARVTEMRPNVKFVERMQLKQKASADRAIAREQRIQEEEQRLLAITKGERQVAERQASAKVEQIEKTTNAETVKQLVLTEANQTKDQAAIQRETAAIHLETARIEAEIKRTKADAEAYQKREILLADNALQQKLDAEIAIQKYWAEAFSKRAVPTTVFGAGGAANGTDSDVQTFMQLMTVQAAKALNYDRALDAK
jgi:hypothetical protein